MGTELSPPPAPQFWGGQDRGVNGAFPYGNAQKLAKHPRQSPPRIGGRGGATTLLFLCLLLVTSAFPALARADALDDRVREVARGLRCPVCSGETVADSNAPISVQMRGIIREKLEAGESRDQIDAYFVSRYGPEILLTPQASGFTLGVWVMPIVALVVGFLIVLAVLRSWSRRGDAPIAPAEDVAPAPADDIPASDDARLEQELARFRHGPKAGDGVAG